MKNYQGVELVFIAPDRFTMEPDILDYLTRHNIRHSQTTELTRVISELDAIYVTRIQSEHDASDGSRDINLADYTVDLSNIDLMKEDAVIMHPLPRGAELSPGIDDDPRAKYWRQERNGMWMRAALLTRIFGAEDTLYEIAR